MAVLRCLSNAHGRTSDDFDRVGCGRLKRWKCQAKDLGRKVACCGVDDLLARDNANEPQELYVTAVERICKRLTRLACHQYHARSHGVTRPTYDWN